MPSQHRQRSTGESSRPPATFRTDLALSALTLITACAVAGAVSGPSRGSATLSTAMSAADIDWP